MMQHSAWSFCLLSFLDLSNFLPNLSLSFRWLGFSGLRRFDEGSEIRGQVWPNLVI